MAGLIYFGLYVCPFHILRGEHLSSFFLFLYVFSLLSILDDEMSEV